jgi:hypothetical protein
VTIHQAIPAIMAEIGSIGKDRKNQQQSYQYRGIEDFYNVIQPLMVKYKVFSVPTVLEQKREERESKSGGVLTYTILTIKYAFFAEDGSNIEAIVVGEGMDSGDKSSNKAMSVAHKYALAQIFAVPTKEMVDPEVDSPEPLPKKGHTVSDANAATVEQAVRDAKAVRANSTPKAPADDGDNPLRQNESLKAEIGRLATMLKKEDEARKQIAELGDFFKSQALDWEAYMSALGKYKDELAGKVAELNIL